MLEVEISQIDRRYESYRLKDKLREKLLLSSLLEKGVLQPVSGVRKSEKCFILLDGFKRLRCAIKLKISVLPVESIGETENRAIIKLINISNSQKLNTVEEAIFVNELYKTHQQTLKQIASELERSPAWVSIRLGIIDEMSKDVREAIFSGKFPLRSYMYTLRPFTRVKGFDRNLITSFVNKVSGKDLSTRDIDKLAYIYFRGSPEARSEIDAGKAHTILDYYKKVKTKEEERDLENDLERKVINNLELFQKYMNFVMRDIMNPTLISQDFKNTAKFLISGILKQIDDFINVIRRWHDSLTHKRNS